MSASFERFCLAAGIESLTQMLEQDAVGGLRERHERGERRKAHRWGSTKGKIGFHGGKNEVERPRVRGRDGGEYVLPSWEGAVSEDLLEMGDEPDADQRVDAQIQAFGLPARRGRSGRRRSRLVEVGDFPALRVVVGGAHEGVDVDQDRGT